MTAPNTPPQVLEPVPHASRRIGLLYTSRIEAARELCAELEKWLARLGVEVCCDAVEEADEETVEQIATCDLLLTLGGDGTALRAARLAAPFGVPLVCVGLGRLSFMAELVPADVLKELPTFLAGDYWLEERAMLEGIVLRQGKELARCLALNEVVLGRERTALTLHVKARVDGVDLTHYLGDAVIVATATGSTAYALSVGGPVLSPESQNLVLVPVAAHLSLLPPVVLPENSQVELEVVRGTEAGVNCDGQPLCDLQLADIVQVCRSSTACYFARIQERGYFFHTLKERLYRRDH